MAADDCLRLAWEADHDGRGRLRDSLLTLAVVDSGPNDTWAERCRARLIADRPGHFLAAFATVRAAQDDPRVMDARDRLRIKFPEGRVGGLLLRAQARRGPYTGRPEAIEALVEDLAGPRAEAENLRRDAPELARGPWAHARSSRPVLASLQYAAMPRAADLSADSQISVEPDEDDDRLTGMVLVALAWFLWPRAGG